MTTETTTAPLVLSTIEDGVALLTWNRPERNNAWTVELEGAYFDLLEQCTANPAVRAIVVTGAGKSFCPGLDAKALDGISNGIDTKPHERRPMTLPTAIPKPIIAAINGACAGVGLIQALACDLRFVASTARLSTAFSRRGIMAEHGVAWLLPRVVGWGNAVDLLYSGRVIGSEEALAMGLVNRVIEPSDLLPAALQYARELATWASPTAVGYMKEQLLHAQTQTLEEARQEALGLWRGTLRVHPDFREGVRSFIERREPSFAPWAPK
ncbi:enoyl-CoA hydratase-related protein [Phytohabitans suffuscus]|uniref:Enoyl-CoA hydratase n=1 Tax=Phytohabitans suffuscus TaxID=624315 RepID=A0A6F8YR02_9ACTN|nr:enoyl-CoA hydratase-related protein [Phytohabitans suffuscus]BCB88580.1 enoyl-CoA hydratase [Phytohabitans suffuscus]